MLDARQPSHFGWLTFWKATVACSCPGNLLLNFISKPNVKMRLMERLTQGGIFCFARDMRVATPTDHQQLAELSQGSHKDSPFLGCHKLFRIWPHQLPHPRYYVSEEPVTLRVRRPKHTEHVLLALEKVQKERNSPPLWTRVSGIPSSELTNQEPELTVATT